MASHMGLDRIFLKGKAESGNENKHLKRVYFRLIYDVNRNFILSL
jgi:hypothetical protein